MKKIIFISIFLIANLAISAQDFKLRHIKTDIGSFPAITSSLQVYDSFDEPVTGLKSSNFSGSIDGKKAQSIRVKTYRESGLGLNIMLCIDLSGSMNGKPLETMKSAIIKFIDGMRSVDKLAITGFSNDSKLVADFSSDREYLKDIVRNLHTSGNQTALYYGANQAVKRLADNRENIGKIMILIGDGKNENNSGSYTEDDAIGLAREAGIPIFTIGYTKINASYLQSFERISEKTGGNFYNAPKDEDLSRQYEKLYRQILNIYLVTYQVPEIKSDGLEHLNVVTLSQSGSTKSVSDKFTAPSGSAVTPDVQKQIPSWYYMAGGALILLIAAGSLILIRAKKKKKLLLKETERQKEEAYERERKERLELERRLDETQRAKAREIVPQANRIRPEDADRTVILKKGIGETKPEEMHLRLEIMTGQYKGQRFEIDSRGATIGRADGNSIVIKEATVSGQHARIIFSGNRFFLEDLGSSNGTFVNSRPVSNVQLNQNDIFKFGHCEGTVIIY